MVRARCDAIVRRFLYGSLRCNYRLQLEMENVKWDISRIIDWTRIREFRGTVILSFKFQKDAPILHNDVCVQIDRNVLRSRKNGDVVIVMNQRERYLTHAIASTAFIRNLYGQDFDIRLERKNSFFKPPTAVRPEVPNLEYRLIPVDFNPTRSAISQWRLEKYPTVEDTRASLETIQITDPPRTPPKLKKNLQQVSPEKPPTPGRDLLLANDMRSRREETPPRKIRRTTHSGITPPQLKEKMNTLFGPDSESSDSESDED